MKELLTKHLEQISKIISELGGENTDIEKLTELSQSLELLSHQIKTSHLEVLTDGKNLPDRGINQDAAFYFNRKFQIFRITGQFQNVFNISSNAFLPEVSTLFTSSGYELFKEKTELLLETAEPQSFVAEVVSKNGLMLPVYFLLEKIILGDLEAVSAGMTYSSQTPGELDNYREILIENIPGIDVYLFDTAFRYVLSGGREKERMGLSNTDFIGKTLFDVFDEKTMKRLFPFYRNALEGNESEGEVRVKGRVYFIHATPIFGFTDQVVGGAVISQDVTAEKEVERNLLKAKREAEESNNAKSIFMANMSHEIRTPLNAIIGFSNLLNKSELNPEQEKYSSLIKQSSEHLLSVVNEILFLFKYGMGKVYIEKIPISILDLIANVYESLNMKAQDKGINLEISADDQIPEVLIGDPFRLKQILMNLAGNAIKFTEKGNVALKASLEKSTRKNIFIRFVISDTGIGIAQHDLQYIFDEFAQTHSNSTDNSKGVGLGLTIVKKLIELLNGWIHVDSVSGSGSRFTVVLPFTMPHPSKNQIPEKKYELKYNLLSGKRILFADDDKNNILLGESLLKRWKTDYDLAHDGGEALELMKKNKYDIALLDIRMPVLMGTKVVEQVRKQADNLNTNTKILAVTANIMESDIQAYLKSGFNGYILKPFEEEYLYNRICNLLNLNNSLLENQEFMKEEKNHKEKITFDTELLLKTTGGNADFFNKMIDTFIANATETAESFRTLQKTGNWAELGEKAHKAIPSFSYFGLKDLVSNLTKMENRVLREKNNEGVGHLAISTANDIDKVIKLAQQAKM